MRRRYLDLLLTIAIALINVACALIPIKLPLLAFFLALPLIFFLPGYALIDILSYKSHLSALYRFVVSVVLSVVIDILGGFMLNFFPIGLGKTSWAELLGLLTIVFTLIAIGLRRKSTEKDARPSKFYFRFYEYVLVGLSILLVILTLQYSAVQKAQSQTGFTQLWMLPSAPVNNNCAVQLGVRSFEVSSVTYRITMNLNGVPVQTWQSLALKPQQEWDQLVQIHPKIVGAAIYVEIALYKTSDLKTVYREVHMTLNPIKINDKGALRC